MSTIETTRELSKYVNKKIKSVGHRAAFSDKGKTHQRMSWQLWGFLRPVNHTKLVAKVKKKLAKAGIEADVYISKANHVASCPKINIKMTLDQHAKLRTAKLPPAKLRTRK
jgi:hypothetical protein